MGRRDWALLVGLSLLWGGSFLFVELALRGVPAMMVVWCRVTGGALLLALWLWMRGVGLPVGWRAWRALGIMGVLNNAVPFACFAVAQGEITGGLAAILNAMTPILTVLALWVFAGERPGAGRVLGVLAGFAGVAVMMGGGVTGGALWAKGLCLVAAGSYALGVIWGRRFRGMGLVPGVVAFGQCATAAVLLLPVVPFGAVLAGPVPGVEVWLALAGLAVLSTALAYVIFFHLLAVAGPVNVQLVTLLIPVSAVVMGAILLGERLEARHLAGAALIGAGLVALDGRLGAWVSAARGGR